MYLQEQISEIIDLQTKDFVKKAKGVEREKINSIPRIQGFVSIITGLRRCGKSTLLLQIIDKSNNDVIYLNWEDIRLTGFETDDFGRLYKEIKQRNINILCFDEIQLIHNWEIFVHQLLREGFEVYVTGSNASLLSFELGTHLTGRHLSTELFPFSFTEFCTFTKTEPNSQSLEKYMQTGGLPDFVKSGEMAVLQNLLNDILIRDIAVRYAIKDVESLKLLAIYLLTNVASPVSANKLTEVAGLKATSTVLEYFSYLKNAYLVDFVMQFSYSLKTQIRNPKKVYAIDTGFISAVSTSYTENAGRKFENLIFLKLRSTFKEIFFFKEQGECDFVIREGDKITKAIQVCYKINDSNTRREFDGLLAALKFFDLEEGVIVTLNQQDEFRKDGKLIRLIPAHIFLQS